MPGFSLQIHWLVPFPWFPWSFLHCSLFVLILMPHPPPHFSQFSHPSLVHKDLSDLGPLPVLTKAFKSINLRPATSEIDVRLSGESKFIINVNLCLFVLALWQIGILSRVVPHLLPIDNWNRPQPYYDPELDKWKKTMETSYPPVTVFIKITENKKKCK